MASPVWPSALPEFFLQDGFRESAPDNVIRSPQSQGAEKRRRRYTAAVRSDAGRIVDGVTTQLDQFKFFFNNAIDDGALEFDFPSQDGVGTVPVAFSKEPELGAEW